MLTCVLNAAEGELNIILGSAEGIICAQHWTTSAKGSIKGAEVLTPSLSALFSTIKYKPSDVQRWACVHGPGSFTGIRLVLGTVAAIRRVTHAQNASIDFLQALALDGYMLAQNISGIIEDNKGQILVLTHARRNMVHCQHFSQESTPKPLHAATLCTLEDAIKDLQTLPSNSLVLGSGLERNLDAITPALTQNIFTIKHQNPSAKALWQLATQAEYHSNDIEPLYIRPCDAVENLDSIAKKQGMEPSHAHARMQELLQQNNY